MIVTTTNNIEGYRIIKYYNAISSVHVFNGNILKGFDQTMDRGVNEGIAKMGQKAEALGANAVVGLGFSYVSDSSIGRIVSMIGTPVIIEPI